MNKTNPSRREQGFVFVLLAASLLVVLCAFAGLAIDVGKAYVVKGQLHNAADAAALAGAGDLYPTTSPTPLSLLPPNWALATSTATTFVHKNNADGTTLTDADIVTVQAGYKNLDGSPPGIQPQSTPVKFACKGTSTPCVSNSGGCVCVPRDVPAVQVSVQRVGVAASFAKVLGLDSFSPGATAVAARGYPSSAKIGFPFAVTKCMVDYYLANGLYGQSITMPDDYVIPNCKTGNWSSLTVGGGGDSVVQNLLDGSIKAIPVAVGDTIEVPPGTRNNLYNLSQPFVGQTILLPVVQDSMLASGSRSAVTGFMALELTEVTSGKTKAIIGRFARYFEDPAAGGTGGPIGNTVTPPALVQ